MRKRSALWFLMMMFCWRPVFAEVSLDDFARTDSYDNVRISPDGRYLALRVPQGQQYGLAVIDLATHKLVSKFLWAPDVSIADYAWASSTRLVLELGENFGFISQPVSTGEIAAIDVDGKAAKLIFSWRGEVIKIGGRLGHETRINASGYLIRTLPKDPDHVLIKSYNFTSNENNQIATAYRVNIHNGERDQGLSSPVSGGTDFFADKEGFIRYAVSSDAHSYAVTYVRTPENSEWRQLGKGGTGRIHARISPLSFSDDNRVVWLSSDENSERSCLVRQDLETGEQQTVDCDGVADLRTGLFSADHSIALGAYYEGGKSRLKIQPGDEAPKRVLRTLQNAFPGQIALPVSRTLDGRREIVEVFSDRNPGDYYLVDTQTMKADYIVGRAAWIDPDQMAERRPVVIKARDGTSLQGFLTLPLNRPEKNLPLVVHPHGGPFFIEDTWRWDLDPQMLASRGYSVLQVNYRGSGGLGAKFQNAGRQGWDAVMIDDITDATRWAIAQGIADPRRVCIYGGSYGGYASLMSVEREPDLYRCAIGYAGIYDFPLWAKTADFTGSVSGANYISEWVAGTTERLIDASPVSHVDRLKAALFIAHGTQDKRAPISQARALRSALESHHYPFEWMEVAGEGHGFYSPEHRKELFEKMLAFLDKQIGPGVVPLPPSASEPQPASQGGQ